MFFVAMIASVLSFFSSAVSQCGEPFNIYNAELLSTLAQHESTLSQAASLGSGVALGVLRLAQWENFLMATQGRQTTWTDRMGYFFMESDVAGFSDRCYGLAPSELPQLYELAQAYATKLGIPVPLILLIDDRKLCDAISANWSTKSGFIILGRGVFEEYNSEQFCGMIAYQMGHLAQRTKATMAKYFAPGALAGFITALWLIASVSRKNQSMLVSGGASAAILATYGLTASLYWCWLSRYCQRRADRAVAVINPSLGLVLIDALAQSRFDDCGGDLVTSEQIIKKLPSISENDRGKALAALEKVRKVYLLGKQVAGTMDIGFFGTQHSLEERRAFFEKK